MDKIYAPWSDEQVTQLQARQEDYGLHPYTCQEHGEFALRPTPKGWTCRYPGCVFSQNWAHASDLIGGP